MRLLDICSLGPWPPDTLCDNFGPNCQDSLSPVTTSSKRKRKNSHHIIQKKNQSPNHPKKIDQQYKKKNKSETNIFSSCIGSIISDLEICVFREGKKVQGKPALILLLAWTKHFHIVGSNILKNKTSSWLCLLLASDAKAVWPTEMNPPHQNHLIILLIHNNCRWCSSLANLVHRGFFLNPHLTHLFFFLHFYSYGVKVLDFLWKSRSSRSAATTTAGI